MFRLQIAAILGGTARDEDMHSVLYRLSNVNCKMFLHISVNPQIYNIIKNVLK
jgi:hypothetical protein